MGDFQDNKTSLPSTYSRTGHTICANCGIADISDKSSGTSTSSSSPVSPNEPRKSFIEATTPKHTTAHPMSTIERRHHQDDSSDTHRLISYRRCESCTDLNGNSRKSVVRHSLNSKKSPSLATLAKNVTAVRPFSVSLDAAHVRSSHRNHETLQESRESERKASPVVYLTPLQRKERESKEMKKEISRLYNELSQKDQRIFQLQLQLEEQMKDYQDELDRKIADIQELMEDKENLLEASRQEKINMEEELTKMDQLFTDMKVKQQLQEDQFQERYLDMYKRGQKAAMFEREQELEMIASSKQPKVTVRELTRKLSITESELAKWQSYRLEETYKSADKPLTDADVTLSFLRDSFYHFVCNREDCLRHFRAIVEIFRYSDTQMGKIRKTVSESKDFARLFKKDVG